MSAPRDRTTLAAWALAAMVVLLYLPALGGEVLDWDDNVWVADPIVQMAPLAALTEAFGTVQDRAWYPVVRLSWWVQWLVFGDSTRWMHGVNLALFAACIPALVGLLRRCGLSAPASLVAVGLWACHPSRVESVAWLSSRKDLLSLALVLGAAAALVPERDRPPSIGIGTGLAALAALSKVAVIPVFGVIWLVVRAREGRSVANRTVGPTLLVGAVVGVLGLLVFHGGEGPVERPYLGLVPNLVFAFWQLGSWTLRLGQLTGLAAVIPLPVNLAPLALLGLGVLLGSLVAAWRAGSRWAEALVGLVWLPLLPVSGVVSMAFWAADRHLLYPSLAVAVGVALVADRALTGRGALRYAPLVLALPLAWGSSQRIGDWRSSLTLWEVEGARPGDHWVRGLQLGTALGRVGRFDEALAAYRRSEALKPGDGAILARRVIAQLAADGDWSMADRKAAAGLQPLPQTAADWSMAAAALVDTGDLRAARDVARHAVKRGASDQSAHLVLAAAAAVLGDESPEPHLQAAARASGLEVEALRTQIRRFVEDRRR